MKLMTYGDETIQIYQPQDIEDIGFKQIVDDAKRVWRRCCDDYYKNNGDRGPCVLGAGIYIHYLPKKKRKPVKHRLISAFDVTPAQGCFVWEHSAQNMVKLLRDQGIHCWFEYGRMD